MINERYGERKRERERERNRVSVSESERKRERERKINSEPRRLKFQRIRTV